MRISDWSSDVCSSYLRRLHRRAVAGVETDCLEVREAPPDFAEPGLLGEAVAIGGDAVVLPPDGLEHMAIAHPQLGIVGEALGTRRDRKSVVEGKSGSVRVELGGRRVSKKKKRK